MAGCMTGRRDVTVGVSLRCVAMRFVSFRFVAFRCVAFPISKAISLAANCRPWDKIAIFVTVFVILHPVQLIQGGGFAGGWDIHFSSTAAGIRLH